MIGQTRRFTPQWAQIALLIADPRSLSYAQIGEQLSPPIEERTVKMHVRAMCDFFDDDTHDAHPPRVQILVWIRHLQWQLKRLPTITEIIEASAQRDV